MATVVVVVVVVVSLGMHWGGAALHYRVQPPHQSPRTHYIQGGVEPRSCAKGDVQEEGTNHAVEEKVGKGCEALGAFLREVRP